MSESSTPTCGTCKYWAANVQDIHTGSCRKETPKTFIIVGQRGPEIIAGWPSTQRTQWCGEHKSKVVMSN